MDLNSSQLGKKSAYHSEYNAGLLFAIPRQLKRRELGLGDKLPFHGVDIWTSFEISWLDAKGKPEVRIGVFEIESDSENIIESKSFKLYLNSLNQSKFTSASAVEKTLRQDVAKAIKGNIQVQLFRLDDYSQTLSAKLPGISLDALDIEADEYITKPGLLALESHERVSETLNSDLLKSNCLVTGQPDWGSVMIAYQGAKIRHESLLKYLISFRNHHEFHEQCVERIYCDLMQYCRPEKLLVYARYTRRGGLDINPLRCNYNYAPALKAIRLVRQ